MSERVVIKIVPSTGGDGDLTVQSAMLQVLDAFDLLTAGETSVQWRLVSASTNSPLTVVAESENVEEASSQKRRLNESLQELRAGRFPQAWKRPELTLKASSFLARSSSLARTEFQFDAASEPVVIADSDVASFIGLPSLVPEVAPSIIFPAHTKSQVGSVQGLLVEITTYRGRPALRVRERKTGRDITCVLSEQLADSFSDSATVHDVWDQRRVTVRGAVLYQATGQILRIEAASIVADAIPSRPLPPLQDSSFTGGLSAAEYLERFRAGELG